MSIGSRIKESRVQLGLTQEELAEKIGVTKGAIANYENEVSTPKIELMYKLFEALHCDANYLYQDDMATDPPTLVCSPQEQVLVQGYRQLSDQGKQAIESTITALLKAQGAKENSEKVVSMPKQQPTKIQRGYAAFGGDGWKNETIEVDPAAVDAAFAKAEARQKEREAQEEESRRNYFRWLEEQEAKQAQEKKSRKRRK